MIHDAEPFSLSLDRKDVKVINQNHFPRRGVLARISYINFHDEFSRPKDFDCLN